MIVSTNPDTLETYRKKVLESYVRQVDKLVNITINSEKIVTTDNHPFYVQGRGFIDAGSLLVGDKLVSVNGEDLVIEKFCIEETENLVDVYNVQVEDFHTYYVCKNGALVHNSECGIQENGYVDAKKVAEDPSEFTGKSINDYASEMEKAGYEFKIKTSTRSRSGAQKIVVENGSNTRNISQLQVSPGGGRHGSQPYVKISTTDQGIIKVVTGDETMYRTDGLETANIIFTEK